MHGTCRLVGMDTSTSPLDRAIAAVGGASALARALGLPWASTVTNWAARGVPADRCLPIERATGGAVTRYDLRPDIFGDAPDGAPAREAG
jgi:DNA-binding transcriptional regulator YdaS (Cro superfamily)